jgi:hypothetical protein
MKIKNTKKTEMMGRITSFHMNMGKWLLITRILQKYGKSLSSLISDYIDNFIDIHIHILYEDSDIHDIIMNDPGISNEDLGLKVFELSKDKVIKNYIGKPSSLICNKRINAKVITDIPKIIDDKGQFR